MKKTEQQKILKALQAKIRFHSRVYEKRCMIDGVLIDGSGATEALCEEDFCRKLTELFLGKKGKETGGSREKPLQKKLTFGEWSETWFKTVYEGSVLPDTYYRQHQTFLKHVLPTFGKKYVTEITFMDCTAYFKTLAEKNIERTAENCYTLLNRILVAAAEEGIIEKNPMRKIKPIKHERKNGIPLSKDEELILLENVRGKKYETMILISLYTGLRPCELSSAKVEGEFIVAQNRKQKNPKKIVYKKIPITPMLRRYREKVERELPGLTKSFSLNEYRKLFKEAIPNHRLYDLRDTFATRCQQCGVTESVVQLWMGHSAKTVLGRVYTKFDDEYLLKEGNKVEY